MTVTDRPAADRAALFDDRHRSLWLREALVGEEPAPPLEGSVRADVAIVGGGYVGLWTALRIKEADPACDVVVVERDVCGGGASGRNGGFALSWWTKLPSLVKRFGAGDALALGRASEAAVDELGAFCERHGIDAHFRKAGWLWTATTPAQLGGWEDAVSFCEQLGVEAYERLTPEEVARRTGSPAHLAGVLDRTGATVHPGLLVRGLARVARSSVSASTSARTSSRWSAARRRACARRAASSRPARSSSRRMPGRPRCASCTWRSSSSPATSSRPSRSRSGWRRSAGQAARRSATRSRWSTTTARRATGGSSSARAAGRSPSAAASGPSSTATRRRSRSSPRTSGARTRTSRTSASRRTGRGRSTGRRTGCRCSAGSAGGTTSSTASAGAATASRPRCSAAGSSRASRSAATTTGAARRSSTSASGGCRPSRSATSGRTSCARGCVARSRPRRRAASRVAVPVLLSRLVPAGLEDRVHD